MKDSFEDLYTQIPTLLAKLNAGATPEWGSMHLLQMLKHVTAGFELSMGYKECEVTTPEEKIPAFQRFLMSEKPLMKNSKIPNNYLDFKIPKTDDLEEIKKRFLEKLTELKQETETNPNFWSIHENFGKLNAEQTRMLHFKHITHHFTQFGVI